MQEIRTTQASIVTEVTIESMHKDVDKVCAGIYTRKSACIRKVKLQKKLWFDLPNLVEVPSSYPPAGGHFGGGGRVGWLELRVRE